MSGEASTAAPANGFTDREQKLMAYAWLCFDEQPKVNYEKLAELAGMTNPRSASNAWAVIKKKLLLQAGDAATGETNGANTPKTPKSGGGKRKKSAAEVDDEETPSKKAKAKTPAKGKKGGKTAAAETETESAEDSAAVKDEKIEDDEELT